MSGLKQRFLRSEDGSFAPAMVIVLVPLLAAVGMVSDYSLGVSEKISMQNALDAASLSSMTLSKDLTKGERQAKLQAAYAANGGKGAATLLDYLVSSDGTATLSASASYAMPTNFMGMAGIDTVEIDVAAAARKNPALIEATFKIKKVSGWWDKTMTLYGVKFGETEAKPLMTIAYQHLSGGDKGYGTTTVSTPNEDGTFKVVQKQECVDTTDSNWTYMDSGKKVKCTLTIGDGTGAPVDVSTMNQLYLEMKIPNPNPGLTGKNKSLPGGTKETLQSNNADTSNYLYIGGKQSPAKKAVDIFSAVPCNETSTQAWEDGGTTPPSSDVNQADFFYDVTGKCDFSQRPSEVALTR
jgi:Flp pilus assembly protein TadG